MSMLDRFRLDGRVAVVTGASGGIGSAAAEAFAQAGADVALLARNRAKLDEAATRVAAAGQRVLVVEADVVDEAAVGAAAARIDEELGRADILFNNAGVTTPLPLAELELEEWRRVLEVNLTGAYICTRAFGPGMIARRFGRIVNMGSILSGRGMATRTAYCASKAGLANFGAAAAFEFGPHGVTVNTIGASVIVTDLNRKLIRTQPELYDQVLRRTAVGRLGEVDDVIAALLFLTSPAAAFVTGQTLFVDGGYTAG